MLGPRLLLTFFALTALLAANIAASTVFVYYTASASLVPQRPEVILAEPNSPNVSVTLGPALASASVVVYTSNFAQLVYNPDFFSSPDGWYCAPSASLTCYWLPGDQGASGGVISIESNTSIVFDESAFILQEVTVPNTNIVRVIVNVTLRGDWAFSPTPPMVYEVGLWDPQSSAWAWLVYDFPSTQYTSYTWDITPYLEPGRRYILAIGMYVVAGVWPALYVDSAYLSIETSSYVFSQPILAANVTSDRVLYARLKLEALSVNPSLNASIWLVNSTAHESSRITIRNGFPTSWETSWIAVSPPIAGYYAALIQANASKASPTNSSVSLVLEYCTLPQGMGACVSYPVTLIIDPRTALPHHSGSQEPPGIQAWRGGTTRH